MACDGTAQPSQQANLYPDQQHLIWSICTLFGPGCLSWVDTPLLLCSALSSLTAWAAPVFAFSFLGEERAEACLLEVLGTSSLSPASSGRRNVELAAKRTNAGHDALRQLPGRRQLCPQSKARGKCFGIGCSAASSSTCRRDLLQEDPWDADTSAPTTQNMSNKLTWNICRSKQGQALLARYACEAQHSTCQQAVRPWQQPMMRFKWEGSSCQLAEEMCSCSYKSQTADTAVEHPRTSCKEAHAGLVCPCSAPSGTNLPTPCRLSQTSTLAFPLQSTYMCSCGVQLAQESSW